MKTLTTMCWMMLLILVPYHVHAFENAIGVELGRAKAHADICEAFPADSGCVAQDNSYRLFYGARVNSFLEIRGTWTLMDIRMTDAIDPIFNDPSVSSDIIDVGAVLHWRAQEWLTLQTKVGLAYWQETRSSGAIFFGGDSDAGLSPVLGVNAEFGDSWIRAALSIDVYPGAGDTDYIHFIGAGIRFVW